MECVPAARDADPTSLNPTTGALLRAVRREIATTLLPELESSRARTMAQFIDVVLRHAIMRDEAFNPILAERSARYAAILGCEPPASAPPINENCAANRAMAIRIEGEMASGTFDGASAMAAIQAEAAFIEAQTAFEQSLEQHTHAAASLLEVPADRVERYLRTAWPGRANLTVNSVVQILGGFSKDTYIVELSDESEPRAVVVRRDNPFGTVDSTVADEFRLLRELYVLGIPVPEPLLLEEDPSILGQPFMVSTRVPGRSIENLLGLEVGEDALTAARGLARALGALHGLDIGRLSAEALGPVPLAADLVAKQIEAIERRWRDLRVEPSPTMVATFQWLRQQAPPPPSRLSLVHGDAGLHNLLMDGSEVSAMLDWEFAHFGDAAEDLTYCRTWVNQVMPWDEFLAEYHAHGGPPYCADHARFYTVLYNARHVMTIGKGMRGFSESPNPALSSVVANLNYARRFTVELARLVRYC